MSYYEFQPDKKRKKRNRHIGKWTEVSCRKVDLPFTSESLRQLLIWGANPETSPATHQEIAHWCGRYAMCARGRYDEAKSYDERNALNSNTSLRRTEDVAQDVECQWELYLANTYTFEQLKNMDHSIVKLPCEWFIQWLEKLNNLEGKL